jgi:hypothetical protein
MRAEVVSQDSLGWGHAVAKAFGQSLLVGALDAATLMFPALPPLWLSPWQGKGTRQGGVSLVEDW